MALRMINALVVDFISLVRPAKSSLPFALSPLQAVRLNTPSKTCIIMGRFKSAHGSKVAMGKDIDVLERLKEM